MNDAKLQSLAQIRQFLSGTVGVEISLAAEERYGLISRAVRRFGYSRLGRADKTTVLRFLERVSGYSRQHLTRLVAGVEVRTPLVKRFRASRTSFGRTFTEADVRLLAQTDTST